jgi:hypothetical protein
MSWKQQQAASGPRDFGSLHNIQMLRRGFANANTGETGVCDDKLIRDFGDQFAAVESMKDLAKFLRLQGLKPGNLCAVSARLKSRPPKSDYQGTFQ